MASNAYRGEVRIPLQGRELVLVPTFAALARCESATGKTLQVLCAEALSAALGLSDTVAVIAEGMEGRATTEERAQIGELVIHSGGVLAVTPLVGKFLVWGLTGGLDSSDEDAGDQGEAPAPGGIPSGAFSA
jgi:hypothetical protein